MSDIEEAFNDTRLEYGLKQHPNWSGTVYGACMTKGCGNYRKIGSYLGGFCKLCSKRHPDDKKLPIISAPNTPNPKIRWITKRWVKDISGLLSPAERKAFYLTPEQKIRQEDRVDYKEIEEETIIHETQKQ